MPPPRKLQKKGKFILLRTNKSKSKNEWEIKWSFKCTRWYSPLTICMSIHSHIKQKFVLSVQGPKNTIIIFNPICCTKKNKLDVFRVYENMQSRDGKNWKWIMQLLYSCSVEIQLNRTCVSLPAWKIYIKMLQWGMMQCSAFAFCRCCCCLESRIIFNNFQYYLLRRFQRSRMRMNDEMRVEMVVQCAMSTNNFLVESLIQSWHDNK